MRRQSLFKTPDILLILLAVACIAVSIGLFWIPIFMRSNKTKQGLSSERHEKIATIYDQGVPQHWPLSENRVINIRGTEIEIFQGKVRVRRDFSPLQYCVKQGWLEHEGETAICAPSRIRIEIHQLNQELQYDHLNF